MADGPQIAAPQTAKPTARSYEAPRAQALEPLDEFVAVISLSSQPPDSLSAADRKALTAIEREYRNCCGPYAVTAACRAYGVQVTLPQVIASTNKSGMYTTSIELSKYLQTQGLSAPIKNFGTLDQAEAHLKSGNVAIFLTNASGEEKRPEPHWITVGGVRRDADGGRLWTVSDAALLAGSSTGVGEVTDAELMKIWNRPLGVVSTIDFHRRSWIAVGGAPTLLKIPVTTALADLSATGVKATIQAPAKAWGASQDLIDRIGDKISERFAQRAQRKAAESDIRSATLPKWPMR